MELTLYKAHRADGKGEVEGFYRKYTLYNRFESTPKEVYTRHFIGCFDNLTHFDHIFEQVEIKPETLSIFTGLTAEWFNDGIDPRIWSGDVFESETAAGIQGWQVIYKNAAFYVQRLDDQEIEKLLFDFISDNVYKKTGSIHDKK